MLKEAAKHKIELDIKAEAKMIQNEFLIQKIQSN